MTMGICRRGEHEATPEEIEARFGWNEHRQKMLLGLWEILLHLKRAHCTLAYLDGSFVTRKHKPADFDLCWQELSVDESLLPRVFFDFTQKRAAQRRRFGEKSFWRQPLGELTDGPFWISFNDASARTGGRASLPLNLIR
jgi:hypothetical protein